MDKRQVRVSDPKGGLRKVEVNASGVTIGSGRNNDVMIEGDVRLSYKHGRLWLQDDQVWYEDLGSSFGSFIDAQKLKQPTVLGPGVTIRLSETHLSLAPSLATSSTMVVAPSDLPPGMELRMQGQAGSQGLMDALGSQGSAVYVGAIYDVVDRLLRSSSRELIPEALRRLRNVVPAAQRVALVAWPPDEQGHFTSLLPEQPGEEGTVVSTTMARHAVENRQALMMADGGIPEGFKAGPSMMGIRSAVYVPLVTVTEEVIGLLCVDSPSPTLPLTSDHFQFICAIGGLLTSTLTAEKLREQARRQQLDAEADKARREALVSFLQIASHDLKNQLTAIITGARMIHLANNPEQKDRLATLVYNAGGRAADLIKAYLDVSEVESGHALMVDWAPLDARHLLDEEISVLQLAFQDRLFKLRLVNEVKPGDMYADERKLRQILSNLVSNAIKYSPSGGDIVVSSDRLPTEVQFHVKDCGVGISAEDQQKLFAAFQRVGDLNLAQGTGLGLWLTAALVAAHGGRIWVQSTPGQGAVFSFNVPQNPPRPPMSGPPAMRVERFG